MLKNQNDWVNEKYVIWQTVPWDLGNWDAFPSDALPQSYIYEIAHVLTIKTTIPFIGTKVNVDSLRKRLQLGQFELMQKSPFGDKPAIGTVFLNKHISKVSINSPQKKN